MFTIDKISDTQRDSLIRRIGNTPLFPLRTMVENPNVTLLAKAEWYNPGGSVKDRAAMNMILEGERSGKLVQGKTIIDATSGNTGIAFAMIGAVLGYDVELVIPANVGIERKRIIEAYGARITFSDPLEGTDGAQDLVKSIVEKDPERFFYPDQYNNPANWKAHYATTGLEILEQTNGTVTHIVCGLGTTGTFVGTTRRLKEADDSIQSIAVEPDASFHGLEGLKHLPTAHVPGIYDPTLADRNIEVATEDAYAMVKRLAREDGLLVGISSGAATVAALEVASTVEEGTIVVIFPDDASKYLNHKFWED